MMNNQDKKLKNLIEFEKSLQPNYNFKSLTDRVKFGKKHLDKTICDIVENDSGYLVWCWENIEKLQFSRNLLQEFEEKYFLELSYINKAGFVSEEHEKIILQKVEELSKNEIISFGKYKGKTLQSIIKKDITYFMWCLENSAPVPIDNESTMLLNKLKPFDSTMSKFYSSLEDQAEYESHLDMEQWSHHNHPKFDSAQDDEPECQHPDVFDM